MLVQLSGLSIQRKLTLTMLAASLAVLTLALGAQVIYDLVTFRSYLLSQAGSLAEVVAQNSTAALSFNDKAAAQEILDSLKQQSEVEVAAVFDKKGEVFAQYNPLGRELPKNSDKVLQQAIFLPRAHNLSKPIYLGSKQLGSVYLQISLSGLQRKIKFEAFFACLVLCLSSIVAFLLSTKLQRFITQPILQLAGMAEEVSKSQNFSIRAPEGGKDEVGVLAQAFNKMLTEIEVRDMALDTHRANLENQIRERTHELQLAKESAEQSSIAKGQFLANMSHEIRTPLNGIMGMAELAIQEPTTEDQRSYLETVIESSHALLEIINDVLDFSKIEAGKLELAPVEFRLEKCVAGIQRIMSVQAQGKGVHLYFTNHFSNGEIFLGDEGRLRQVLLNLISNAVKFTEAGGKVEVSVAKAGQRDNLQSIRFSVRDTGIGISNENLGAIFEPFTQADGRITRKYGGTGLGLSISRRLVELFGGTLKAESSVGQGSCFSFDVHMKQVGLAEVHLSQPIKLERIANQGAHILLVEDNPVNQKLAQKLLEKRGHQWTLARNGREAVELWRKGGFDLILMDCQMPEMSGYEATEHIRREEGITSKHIPIIAMTAQAMQGDREECLRVGMDSYVSKPINPDSLFDEINKQLQRRAEKV